MVVYLEFMKKSRNLNLKNLSVDGGMVKNKFFLQLISNLLEIELNIPEMEDMSSYGALLFGCLLYTSPSPRDATLSRMPSSA